MVKRGSWSKETESTQDNKNEKISYMWDPSADRDVSVQIETCIFGAVSGCTGSCVTDKRKIGMFGDSGQTEYRTFQEES